MKPAVSTDNKLKAVRVAKNRLPAWFKQDIPDAATRGRIQLLSEFNVNTVCRQARCPNLSFCFKNLKFTFMILGDTCTRNCKFCAVKKSGTVLNSKQKCPPNRDTLRLPREPSPLIDLDEPYRISQIVKILNLKFVVITSVTRDDLADGGAAQFVKTIESIRKIDKNIKIEALIPDFLGSIVNLKAVIDAQPSILAHNIETVRRLCKILRPRADYGVSLDILSKAKEINPLLITKSSLILGLGETEEEILYTMEDLRASNCDILTLGQYLAPSKKHYPVKEFITMEQFRKYAEMGLDLGFKSVLSGPKVRSSFQAEKLYAEAGYV